MPFRRLPDSDVARLQALQAAADRAGVTDPAELAFSATTKTALDAMLPRWKTELDERGQALAAQAQATELVQAQKARLRMWLSHFFQVLNMGIDRGVFAAGDRASYQLDVSQTSLPSLTTEADLLMWGERVVSGEATRTTAGGTALPFPTAADVDAELTAFRTLRDEQSSRQQAHDAEQQDVVDLRDEVDSLVRDIWDEVEFQFRREPSTTLRRRSRDYGVTYVSRPGEPDESQEPPPEEPPTE